MQDARPIEKDGAMNATYSDRGRDLRKTLEAADIVPLAMVLVQHTGDRALLDEIRPHVQGPWPYQQELPPELKSKIIDRVEALLQNGAPGEPVRTPIDPALLREMMDVSLGTKVTDEYYEFLRQELMIEDRDPRGKAWERPLSEAERQDYNVIIVGAGFSGVCMAIRLKQAGISYVIVERDSEIGGTWYENSYPGCGVDSPNYIYSFSFEPNYDWTRYFSRRDEIWGYLRRVADKHDVRKDVVFGHEVTVARYDNASARWSVEITDRAGNKKTLSARFLISAVGQLNTPFTPDIPGLDQFAGPVVHTARWDHNIKVDGRRVAMIGSGASGMQVGPTIAPDVERLMIFQRSAHWAIYDPYYHSTISDEIRWALKNVPFYGNWTRFQVFWATADRLHASLKVDPEWHLPDVSLNADNHKMRTQLIDYIRREVGDDPVLERKVIPDYPPYGRRMLRDNHWYRMLKRENVDLIDEKIIRVESDGVVTDKKKYLADVLVMATGFKATRMLWPMEIVGTSGRSLRSYWGENDPRAYLGVSVPDFPNFFVLYGPNTNLNHGGAIVFHAECQVRYVMSCLKNMIDNKRRSMECRRDRFTEYNERVDTAHREMVWAHKRVRSWYKNEAGRVTQVSPWRLIDYWTWTQAVDESDYVFE
jgi:4-hydroxyacetophenone monooxygenase